MTSSRCRCQGGFCELVLPNNALASNNNGKGASLSKREKRLQKSRERDRATRLLKWVLTEEEYSCLEETGDLVRLRVKGSINGDDDDDGFWIDGNSVNLAKMEHRPDLARLAFAEFQSSGEGGCDLGNDKSVSVPSSSGVKNSIGDCFKHIAEPSHAGNEADVVVCGTCYNVYTLLGQARELLASANEMDEHDEAHMDADETDDNQLGHPPNDSLENLDDTPANGLKRSSTEGPNSSEWDSAAKTPILSAASFHGPISPHQRNDKDDPKAIKERRKKRDRKQMEENSNIHILVAESDEVCIGVPTYVMHEHVSFFCTHNALFHRQPTSWPNVYWKRKDSKLTL